ncbi:MAG: DUF2079 domain-containing protein [Nitrospirae bacterium]|nr:DUF2079 domain-containing protein [Nitrospirota bacterium]
MMETKECRHSLYIFVALTLILSSLAIFKYVSLHSTVCDLGIFLWVFYKMGVYGRWQLFSYGHLQPFLIPLYLFLKLFPSNLVPYIILFLQSALLSLPSIWLLRRYGYMALAGFVLYFPLWYNALNDFHMDHMVVPLLFGFFLLAEQKKIWLAVVCASCVAFVKEPFALQTAACGIYLMIASRKLLAGTFLFLFGILYFHAATRYMIPYFTTGSSFLDAPAFSWMGHGVGEKLLFIVKHPLTIISEIFSNTLKIKYLIVIFGALCFIPLSRPAMLIPAIPIIGIALLSRHDAYYSFTNHYTAGLIAPFIMAFIKGLPAAESLWEKMRLTKRMFMPLVLTILILGNIWFSPSFLYRYFWIPKHWERHFTAYIPTERDAIIKEAILSNIPSTPDILISTPNNINWDYLIYRRQFLVFPQGVMDTADEINPSEYSFHGLISFIMHGQQPQVNIEKLSADYAVIDSKRPYFVFDKGCQWHYGKCTDINMEERFLGLVRKAMERYDIIYEMDGLVILKRKTYD